jgi:deazaflavin-dependent oxidoreductase (nitroreductase family)
MVSVWQAGTMASARQIGHPSRWWHRIVMHIAESRLGALFFSFVAHPLDRLSLRLTGNRHSLTSILTGIPVVVLTTRGARSGRSRSVPLLGFKDGDNVGLIASNWGGTNHPGWYHNLRANPEGLLLMAGSRSKRIAREADDQERTRLWSRATAVYPGYDVYAARASHRRIPVLVLEPLE